MVARSKNRPVERLHEGNRWANEMPRNGPKWPPIATQMPPKPRDSRKIRSICMIIKELWRSRSAHLRRARPAIYADCPRWPDIPADHRIVTKRP